MTPVKTLDPALLAGIAPGTWVAISNDQETVVGKGQTIDEALQGAKANGEKRPFIMRVPFENAAMIL